MTSYRIGEAAQLLGVSVDTVRRWADAGRLRATRDPQGHRVVAGRDLATFAAAQRDAGEADLPPSSARNRFRGIVTAVTRDTVMAKVEIQAGPHRIVSLLSREAADELRLDIGVLVVAAIKSTNVVVELPTG